MGQVDLPPFFLLSQGLCKYHVYQFLNPVCPLFINKTDLILLFWELRLFLYICYDIFHCMSLHFRVYCVGILFILYWLLLIRPVLFMLYNNGYYYSQNNKFNISLYYFYHYQFFKLTFLELLFTYTKKTMMVSRKNRSSILFSILICPCYRFKKKCLF